jgi:hypothetical protein
MKFRVMWKGACQGTHKSRELAEKRISRIVAMSGGKVKREEFTIEEVA